MQCIKCGCKIPSGELFCEKCSLTPTKKPKKKFIIKAPPPSPKQKQKPKEKSQPAPKQAKSKRTFLAPFILFLLLSLSSWSFIAMYYGEFLTEKEEFKIQQADLAVKMADIVQTEDQLEQTTIQLNAANEALENAQKDYAEASKQLDAMIGNTEFIPEDGETRRTEIEALTTENAELLALLQEAEGDAEEILDLKTEISNLNIAVDFMNKYVVFSNNDDTNLYHRFGCEHFSTSEFWAYNRSLAEQAGKTPCPDCCS